MVSQFNLLILQNSIFIC